MIKRQEFDVKDRTRFEEEEEEEEEAEEKEETICDERRANFAVKEERTKPLKKSGLSRANSERRANIAVNSDWTSRIGRQGSN